MAITSETLYVSSAPKAQANTSLSNSGSNPNSYQSGGLSSGSASSQSSSLPDYTNVDTVNNTAQQVVNSIVGTGSGSNTYNGVTTADNTSLVYQGSNGINYSGYTYNTVEQYGSTVNERVYTDPFGRIQAEYYNSNGQLVNQINAGSQDEFNSLKDQYLGKTYLNTGGMSGNQINSALKNKVKNAWDYTNDSAIQDYTPVQGVVQSTNTSTDSSANQAWEGYLGANGAQYDDYNFESTNINGVDVYKKTYSNASGAQQVEYYNKDNDLIYQYSGSNPDELAAMDQRIYDVSTITNDWGDLFFHATEFGALRRSTDNYTPVEYGSISTGGTAIPQEDTSNWTDADYANWLAEQDAARYDWLSEQSQLDRDARASELGAVNQNQLDQLAVQNNYNQEMLDKQLQSMADLQTSNQNYLGEQNQLNRDFSAQQSQTNFDNTSALLAQQQDFAAGQTAADRDLQLQLQQQGIDAATAQQQLAYEQNLGLLDVTNQQNLAVLDKTFANNQALQQQSLDAQVQLTGMQQQGQLDAIAAQGDVNANLLALTQQGDREAQAQQNDWLTGQQQSAQDFQMSLEDRRGQQRLLEMQTSGDIAMQQQTANNAFLQQMQNDQFTYQSQINSENNAAAANLLDRNLNYQLTAAERNNQYALDQINAAFANQTTAQNAQFEFASQQAQDAYDRGMEMYSLQRQDAIADRDYLAQASREEKALDFEYAQKERDAQNVQRERNIEQARGRALDAYTIGATQGTGGSSASGTSKRYDNQGSAAA